MQHARTLPVSSIASACLVMLITAVLTQSGPAGPDVDEVALPQPDTDLVVGIWRLPLKDLSVGGDLKAHSATIQAAAPLGPIRPSLALALLPSFHALVSRRHTRALCGMLTTLVCWCLRTGDIKKGDMIAELRLDVTGSSLISSLLR